MKIGIASDHRGYELKKEIINSLKDEYEFIDYGTDSNQSVDYPDYAFKLGDAINNKKVEFGVAICGSGIGISIACNKVDGIYCAKVSNEDEAFYTRNDNNTNVVAFSSKTEISTAIKIVKKFVETPFSNDERHIRRINKIKNYEENRWKVNFLSILYPLS